VFRTHVVMDIFSDLVWRTRAHTLSAPFSYTIYTRLLGVTSLKTIIFNKQSCFQALGRIRLSSINLYVLGLGAEEL
jgi:hypothetical protein